MLDVGVETRSTNLRVAYDGMREGIGDGGDFDVLDVPRGDDQEFAPGGDGRPASFYR